MRTTLYLMVPSLMIALGLHILSSALLTFLLFYGWLIGVSSMHKKGLAINFKWSHNSLILGLLSGGIFYLVIFFGIASFQESFLSIDQVSLLLESWKFSGAGLVLVLICINPFLEELYWRGVIHDYLREGRSQLHTLLLTATFYSLYHFLTVIPLFDWPLNVLMVLPVFLAGLFWGYLREKTGSLIGPILSHLLADAGIMSVYWFFIH